MPDFFCRQSPTASRNLVAVWSGGGVDEQADSITIGNRIRAIILLFLSNCCASLFFHTAAIETKSTELQHSGFSISHRSFSVEDTVRIRISQLEIGVAKNRKNSLRLEYVAVKQDYKVLIIRDQVDEIGAEFGCASEFAGHQYPQFCFA